MRESSKRAVILQLVILICTCFFLGHARGPLHLHIKDSVMASPSDLWLREFNEASRLVDDISSMMFERGSLPSGPELPDAAKITIAFPDDGAWKRFHKQLQHFPMVVCAKVREGDKMIVRIKEGNPEGQHIVIVDDLVQSGSTLIECQAVVPPLEKILECKQSMHYQTGL